ncbi:MAG: patatin-like phospholipase family protein [Deltaproteobacteria bacterium]|nr:patatin-like phospholipase family protein [Deltaproteobacteria bacterium]
MAAPARTALVLGGGGVTGGWFELGVLRALEAALTTSALLDIDIVVGVSAGAVVGSQVAAGIAPHQMVAGLGRRGAHVAAPFSRRHMLRPNWRELAARARLVPRRLLDGLWLVATGQAPRGPLDALFALGELVPAGLLDGSGLEAFIRGNLERTACADRFDGLTRALFVVAVDVDTHERVVFGLPGHRAVRISRAVLASSSFPPAFAPCRIDGRDYVDGGVDRNFHLDIAADAGATLLVCVNPYLPLFNPPARHAATLADGRKGRIMDKGMPGVVDQTVRMILHSRMADSVAALRARRPDVDIAMFEPLPDDDHMFHYNVARFSARLSTARVGYLAAWARFTEHWDHWSERFAAHGLPLRREVLDAEADRLRAGKPGRTALLGLLGNPPAQ